MTRRLLLVSAVLEAGIGLALLAWPPLPASLLLGATLDAPAAMVIARVAGAALLALAIACWCARDAAIDRAARGVVAALLFYNVAATLALMHGGLVLRLSSLFLWPTIALHVAMAVWCAASLRAARRPDAG